MSAVDIKAVVKNVSSRVFDPGIMSLQYAEPRTTTIARIQSLFSAAAAAPSTATLPAPALATERRDADALGQVPIDKFAGNRFIVQVNTPAGLETTTERIMYDLKGIGDLVLDKELDKKEARKKGAGVTRSLIVRVVTLTSEGLVLLNTYVAYHSGFCFFSAREKGAAEPDKRPWNEQGARGLIIAAPKIATWKEPAVVLVGNVAIQDLALTIQWLVRWRGI